MENSVVSTIEKIKLLEQDNEAKLKEKRELDATVTSLNRAVKDVIAQSDNLQQEYSELLKTTDRLASKLEVEKIRKAALASQIEIFKKELKDLRAQSDSGISKVWELRSTLCSAVQTVSDECDVWALLIKPITSEPVTKPTKTFEATSQIFVNEEILKKAIARREKAIVERNRLLAEPETGEEFLRIKNALRYSLEKSANLQKQ